MTSLRLVGAGFLLALAILPAMLLNLAGTAGAANAQDEHPVALAAAASGGVSRARATSLDDHPRKPWEGAAESPRADTVPQPLNGPRASPLFEFYLPTPEAAELASQLLSAFPADAPRPLLLNFGSATDKDAAADDIDPFVAVEAGKRRRIYARAMVDQRSTPGPVAVLGSASASTPAAGDAQGMEMALARAAANLAGARLELKLARSGEKTGPAAPLRIEYTSAPLQTARGGKSAERARLSDDIVLNLAVVENHELSAAADAGAPRVGRVLTFKSFKLAREGAGAAELLAPARAADAPPRTRRIIGYLQHSKTMRVLAATELEIKQ